MQCRVKPVLTAVGGGRRGVLVRALALQEAFAVKYSGSDPDVGVSRRIGLGSRWACIFGAGLFLPQDHLYGTSDRAGIFPAGLRSLTPTQR